MVKTGMPSDIAIAQAARLRPIVEIAQQLGLTEEDVELYGKHKAKISLDVLGKVADRPSGKLIVVTAITPTPLGEGKTVTTIGLTQALGKLGNRAIATIRQPSMGPVFGIKGGAHGGGYSQVLPMEDVNLHFTGDTHAVGAAHNLLAAMLEASLLHGNPLGIDPLTISWSRVVDMNDRALRQVVVGLGGKENGLPRETRFDITAASEVMAILALTTSLKDLKERLARIVVGYNTEGVPVTAQDVKAAGAMTVLLKDAIKPNLIQTLEGQPCIMHTGPFGNVAHGNSSVLGDMLAVKLAEYVVTESGFGADNGMVKFMEIKSRQSGLRPSCIVITCSIRALKMHGGAGRVVAGQALPPELTREALPALEKGCANLAHMVRLANYYGIPVVVTVNRFPTDTDAEVELVRKKAVEAGADAAAPLTVWANGGEGGMEAAEVVVAACEKATNFRFLCPDDASVKEKIETLARRAYNASGVSYTPVVERKIRQFEKLGWGKLPINMAKSHLSLSHDPNLKGVPQDYVFPIRDIRASIGAGFLYPIAGSMMTMPGLPTRPAAVDVDIDENGKVVGLF